MIREYQDVQPDTKHLLLEQNGEEFQGDRHHRELLQLAN